MDDGGADRAKQHAGEPGQPLGQREPRFRLELLDLQPGNLVHGGDVAPRVQRHYVHSSPRRLIEGDLGRRQRRRRAVDPNQHGRIRSYRGRIFVDDGDRQCA